MSSQNSTSPLPIGTIICGYRLEKVVGHGGFGITYLGTDQSNGEQVVIKENLPEACVTRAPGERAVTILPGKNGGGKGSFSWATGAFFNEAQTLAALTHPGIVKVLRAFHADETGTDYYVMPYIKGKSLSSVIQLGTRPGKEWLLFVTASLLDALAYVHRKGFLHRDIKPDNVLLEADGRPVLIDFGASRPMNKGNNTVVLTVNYSPVEQKRGVGEGPYTDVYALGATLYHLVSGQQVPPYEFRVGNHDQFKPLVSDPDLVQKYGRAVLASIDKAVGVEPEDRFADAMAWRAALKDEPGFQTSVPVLLDMPDFSLPAGLNATAPIGGTPINIGASQGKRVAAIASAAVIVALLGGLVWVCFRPLPWMQGADASRLSENMADSVTVDEAAAAPGPGAAATTDPAQGQTAHAAATDSAAPAATADTSAGSANPAPQRVLARPDSCLYQDAESDSTIGGQLPLYAIFYVVGESGSRYEVAELPGGESVGWLNKDDVHKWNNNLALQFTHPGGILRRDPALFFDTWQHSQSYFRLPDSARCNILDRVKDRKALDDDIGLIAKEPDKWSPYSNYSLLPVLEFEQVKGVDEQDRPKDELYLRTVALNYTGMPADAGQERGGDDNGGDNGGSVAEKDKPLVDIVFVVDTSRSMQPYISAICNYLSQKTEYISKETGDRARFGFVGFQDFSMKGGKVNMKLCDYVAHVYTPEKMLTAQEFSAMSGRIRATDKDSIDYAEDVLAGVKLAMEGIPWRKGSIRIIYVVGDTCGRSGNIEVGDREKDALRNCDMKTWRMRARGSLTGFTPLQICGMCKSAVNPEDKSSSYAIFPMYILAPPVHDTRTKERRPLFMEKEWSVKCGISQQAWNTHIREGIEFFSALALNHDSLEKGGMADRDGTVTIYSLDNVSDEYVAYLSRELNIKLQVKPFDLAFGESMDDMIGQSGDPKKLEPQGNGRYTAAQSLFQSAYLEWCAVNELNDMDETGRTAEIHGWTSAQDASERDVVKAGVILSRKQLDSLAINLSDLVGLLQAGNDAESATDSLNSLFNLMVLTTTDPNLDPSKQMPEPTLNAYMSNLPWRTTIIQLFDAIIRNGDEITPQTKNELVKQLYAKYEYLKTLGESGNWTKDNTDSEKDLIAIPLDQLP